MDDHGFRFYTPNPYEPDDVPFWLALGLSLAIGVMILAVVIIRSA